MTTSSSELEQLRRDVRRTRWIAFGALATVLCAVPLALRAGTVALPSSFSNATLADATAVNANFQAVKTAVDDNDGRIGALETNRVRGVTTHTDCTRTSTPAAPSITLAAFTVNKRSATSNLLVQASISGHGDGSGYMQQQWVLGAAPPVNAQSVTYSSHTTSGRTYSSMAVLSGHTTTGDQTMVFRYLSLAASAHPFQLYNPNASEDARIGQTCSYFSVIEFEP